MNGEKHWYVLHIKPRKDEVVKALLGRINIETFYPKVKVKKGKDMKIEPLFPLYMFAKFSIPDDYINVKFCRGVRKIVMFGQNIPYLPDEFIENLKTIPENVIIDDKPDFKPGDIVKIKEGPFRGLIGEIVKTTDKNKRVTLLLKATSFSPKVVVPAEHLERITQP